MVEKKDPYRRKQSFLNWKNKGSHIKAVTPENEDMIKAYLYDMEAGINVSSRTKGSRSYSRLIAMKNRLSFFGRKFKELYFKNIADMAEGELLVFFRDVREGNIRKNNGHPFISTDTLAKSFTAFWHWHQRASQKKGITVDDITRDLLKKHDGKPIWVYLDEKQFKNLAEQANFKYKVLLYFMYDSGIRVTEMHNIRLCDLEWIKENNSEYCVLNIRDEYAKTFGRKIKLMMCTKLLHDYIDVCRKEAAKNNRTLNDDDRLFPFNPMVANRYLKRLGIKVFDNGVSKAGEKYSNLTLTDCRHNSACYWVSRYKSERGIMYRFGWKMSDKIDYYTEFLGMKDNIQEEDLLVDTTIPKLERQIIKQDQEITILQDRLSVEHDSNKKLKFTVDELTSQYKDALLKMSEALNESKETLSLLRSMPKEKA